MKNTILNAIIVTGFITSTTALLSMGQNGPKPYKPAHLSTSTIAQRHSGFSNSSRSATSTPFSMVPTDRAKVYAASIYSLPKTPERAAACFLLYGNLESGSGKSCLEKPMNLGSAANVKIYDKASQYPIGSSQRLSMCSLASNPDKCMSLPMSPATPQAECKPEKLWAPCLTWSLLYEEATKPHPVTK